MSKQYLTKKASDKNFQLLTFLSTEIVANLLPCLLKQSPDGYVLHLKNSYRSVSSFDSNFTLFGNL